MLTALGTHASKARSGTYSADKLPALDPAASRRLPGPHHGNCHGCDMPACDLARRISLQSWVLSHDIGGRQIPAGFA
ncbi:hypothetical protein CMUS01_00556 [Colletotrichum musicola]|uniref:Uncharacterized protein n=1 Tax=Colletotrichum musicola TaxID=2175873 RepID=A0A8H6U8Y9_9PEZI|nr:hypothetical protein CMUS01_00556 [Colletotrichum musicola]